MKSKISFCEHISSLKYVFVSNHVFVFFCYLIKNLRFDTKIKIKKYFKKKTLYIYIPKLTEQWGIFIRTGKDSTFLIALKTKTNIIEI